MTTAMGRRGANTMDVRRTVNQCITKLTDRDTEAMGATELESMARSLPTDGLLPFLSAISDTRSSDRTPLRRHCVRLLSVLSESHPPHSLTPLFPRMLSAVLRRLRDPDSSVRSACVQAVRSMATTYARAADSSSSFSAVFLRPLVEALLLEQECNAQTTSAMCLAAAIEAALVPGKGEVAPLQRLVPRLVKLARTDAFKAKPALVSLLGSVVAAGGASSSAALGILIPCLVELLASEDWATRKAAAESLSLVASISDASLLATFKSCCISTCEARRFDKVKIVRDTMNQMLQAWKDLPDSPTGEEGNGAVAGGSLSPNNGNVHSSTKEGVKGGISPGQRKPVTSDSRTPPPSRKVKQSVSRSPPEAPSPVVNNSLGNQITNPISDRRRSSPPLFRKLDRNKKTSGSGSGWTVEVAVSAAPTLTGGDVSQGRRKVPEVDHLQNDDSDSKASRAANLAVGEQEVPCEERGSFRSSSHASIVSRMNHKENADLSLIREQLAQIKNQQSSLTGMLQRFIESTQSSVHLLETRVHDLEMALDEMSHDMASIHGRISSTCWKLPGSELLGRKLSRRSEGRRSLAENRRGFVVNPLAEANSRRDTSLLFVENGRRLAGTTVATGAGSAVPRGNR